VRVKVEFEDSVSISSKESETTNHDFLIACANWESNISLNILEHPWICGIDGGINESLIDRLISIISCGYDISKENEIAYTP